MKPYYTSAISEEKVKTMRDVSKPPWVIVPDDAGTLDLLNVPPARVVNPGDVVLVLRYRSRGSPGWLWGWANIYIIHPASGTQGWFWRSLLTKKPR